MFPINIDYLIIGGLVSLIIGTILVEVFATIKNKRIEKETREYNQSVVVKNREESS